MYSFIKFCIEKIYAPFLLFYLKRDRNFKFREIRLLIKKGVFHPAFFFSTKFLLQELSLFPLRNKTLLELGAGSGLISFYAAKKQAKVTASDINSTAISGLRYNAGQLNLPLTVIHSDLFQNIAPQTFDYIIINPPYYPKDAINEEQMAWYCGAGFEYFHELFKNLGRYVQRNSIVLMSLSQDCEIEQIKQIARRYNFNFRLHKNKRIMWEQNYIYRIE